MEGLPEVNRNAAELARRAYTAMASSFSPAPPHLIPSFRLWHYPAAGRHISWVVFHRRIEDPLGGMPILRRLVWDRDADLQRLVVGTHLRPKRHPSLVTLDVEVDPVHLASLMVEVNGMALPPRRIILPYLSDHQPEFGVEGFDVEGNDGKPIVRIEWDPPVPLPLEPIAGWAGRMRNWLRQLLP